MNVFQLIKSVLDELYARIEGDEATTDAKISEQMTSLRQGYAALEKGITNNYGDATIRFAYIYKYATSHANIVYQLIRDSPALSALFKQDKVNISCIGGGPGSDFLGILKYVINTGKTPHLRCSLFDKEQAWAECWNDVDEKLESKLKISTFFVPFDVTDATSWAEYKKFLASELFTMIYFMSEIYSLRDKAEPFFSYLLENAKPGALLLYVDNRSEVFYGWFDSLMSKHKWKVIETNAVLLKMEDTSEEKKDLGEYYKKFQDPKLTANIAYRICQKQ